MKHINKFKSDIDIYLMFPKCSRTDEELKGNFGTTGGGTETRKTKRNK